MKKSSPLPPSSLIQIVAKALELGVDELEVDYKDGYERVCAMRGNFGVGIASFDASSEDGRSLRDILWAISKKPVTVDIFGSTYRLKVKRFDSFGEAAFRVTITPA